MFASAGLYRRPPESRKLFRMKPLARTFIVISGIVAGLTMSAQAATIGYWRFENSSALGTDSSGNGLTLTNNSATSVSTPFPNPIPQTGASNLLAADLERDNAQYLSVADSSLFAFQDFTIESYIRLESTSSANPQIIASQLNSNTGVNAAWQFGISASSGSSFGSTELFFQASSNGSTLTGFDSDWTISTGVKYYLAASVDFTASDTKVTFYLQDLTNGGALQSKTVTSTALTSLFNSTTNFAIGASYNSGNAARFFDGAIDEVRLSNTALTQSALLTSVPEPSTYALLASLGVFAVVFLRRRLCVAA